MESLTFDPGVKCGPVISWSFERIALSFRISLLCICCFNSGVIHGDLHVEDLTRLVRKGACFSTTLLSVFFQTSHIIWIVKVVYSSPIRAVARPIIGGGGGGGYIHIFVFCPTDFF